MCKGLYKTAAATVSPLPYADPQHPAHPPGPECSCAAAHCRCSTLLQSQPHPKAQPELVMPLHAWVVMPLRAWLVIPAASWSFASEATHAIIIFT